MNSSVASARALKWNVICDGLWDLLMSTLLISNVLHIRAATLVYIHNTVSAFVK